jgi:isopentenyl diphosphate isomerase/L-lactate dehydrogenase-like FMN-dependent dehydrogenase
VRELIRKFIADFDLTMALAGCASVAEIGPDKLVAAEPSVASPAPG